MPFGGLILRKCWIRGILFCVLQDISGSFSVGKFTLHLTTSKIWLAKVKIGQPSYGSSLNLLIQFYVIWELLC